MGKRKAQTQKGNLHKIQLKKLNKHWNPSIAIQSVTDDNKAQSKTSSQQQKKSKNNRTITKKSPQKKATRISDEDKKINYVLNPKKIREKMMEVKEMERREKEKSYQTQSEHY